jgi:hypothetical protein
MKFSSAQPTEAAAFPLFNFCLECGRKARFFKPRNRQMWHESLLLLGDTEPF